MKLNYYEQEFLALVKSGLWEQDAQLSAYSFIDYSAIFKLAEEQSVVGLVAAGLEHWADVKIPKEDILRFVGHAIQLEQRNMAMNEFVAKLIDRLRNNGVRAILVKGQGIAQCYERPLWRSSGDIDLLLCGDNYSKAINIIDEIADNKEHETVKNKERQHQDYQIGGWIVELHGTLHTNLSRKVDKEVDCVQNEVCNNEYFRLWKNGNTQITLPRADEDVIFVFTHILQHLFLEGIGLRQVCDWCRLLFTFHQELDLRLLESRIRKAGIMSEWKVFASLTVDYLGMPSDKMPFYDNRFSKKGARLLGFMLSVGNFGHNRVGTNHQGNNSRRISIVCHKVIDTIRLGCIFPKDAPLFLINYAWDGLTGVIYKFR